MRFFNNLSIIILFGSFLCNAQNENKIFDELKELADKQDYIQQPENSVDFTVRTEIDSLAEKIVNQLSEDPIVYSKIIGERIKHKLPEDKLPYTYIWALGITKNNEDIELIIDCAKNDSSSKLLSNAAFALSQFNDERCGKFILDLIKQNKAKDRFYYLHLLSAMQYEPAIPYFDELLMMNFEESYWKIYFVFGKMGIKGIPHQVSNLNNSNDNIRQNSILLLGDWLTADASITPLKELYKTETNTKVKLSILSSLERLIYDYEDMDDYFSHITEIEQNDELKKYAQEVIDLIPQYRKGFEDFEELQEDDKKSFDDEYNLLFNSAGKEGDWETLGIFSKYEFEPELIELREKVLLRNSDECFYDYQKINRIITYNRIKKNLK